MGSKVCRIDSPQSTSGRMSLESSPVTKSPPALPGTRGEGYTVTRELEAWLLGKRGEAESSLCGLLFLSGIPYAKWHVLCPSDSI